MESDSEKEFFLNLIENVEKKKCLYEKRDAFYYNRNVKERAWKEVAENCRRSAADCKHRWKLLRERFGKELKKMEAPSGSGMSYMEEWALLQPMMFLKNSFAPRRTRDNVEVLDSDQFLEQTLCSGDSSLDYSFLATPVPQKKPKVTLDSLYEKFGETILNIERNLAATPSENPTDEAFMKTVVGLMKDLPVAAKDKFQSKMLQELFELRRVNRNVNSL